MNVFYSCLKFYCILQNLSCDLEKPVLEKKTFVYLETKQSPLAFRHIATFVLYRRCPNVDVLSISSEMLIT